MPQLMQPCRPWNMEKGSLGLICHLCDKQDIKSFTALQFYVVIAAALVGFFDVFIAFGFGVAFWQISQP